MRLAKGGALHDAEAVLFVDDGDGEVVKAGRPAEQGVGADDQVDVAAGDGGPGLGAAAGEQGDPDVAAFEHAAERGLVLLGEELGGGEQGTLFAFGDGHEQGVERDDGLARADVALQHAVHRAGAGEVGGDLFDGRGLGRGQVEGEALADVRVERGRVVQRRRDQPPFDVGPLERDAQLQEEQFVEGESSPGGLVVVVFVGPMDQPQRLGQGRHVVVGDQVRGQRVGHEGQGVGQDRVDNGLDPGGVEPVGRGVDRAEAGPGGGRRVISFVQFLPFGVGHLGVVVEELDLALDAEGVADVELVAEPAGVEPGELEGAGGVLEGGDEAALAAVGLGRDPLAGADGAAGGPDGLAVAGQVTDGGLAGLALVAHGVVAEQVADGDGAEAAQQRRLPPGHGGQVRQGRTEAEGRGVRGFRAVRVHRTFRGVGGLVGHGGSLSAGRPTLPGPSR